ncbi:hypothetical protein ACIBKX_33810 [Streptomyces sp. NPDC050658]|uniref:hypothetical protein n=1 Tax=unclassified Streptomyces TaxID=2593676 RepID=UPI003419783E
MITGSAVANDGQGSRLTATSTEMQQQVFRRTTHPGGVGVIEVHGQSTAVGGPREYIATNTVYGKSQGVLWIVTRPSR